MSPLVVALPRMENLTAFIHQTLCTQDALDPTQTPLFRTPLKKRNRLCGMVFHVEGPRLLRTSAVWSADEDRILFYDSTGNRVNEVRLSESPSLTAEPARNAIDAQPTPAHAA